ncbi:MAG: hypothetical protein KKI20_04390 [Gammaproteobacteria bacterium]|nr:hypothetical protein [Gammaproteobacteria bacterium]MBU2546113.1 hypothetical protein [Gammaproteobacteria bacterium]
MKKLRFPFWSRRASNPCRHPRFGVDPVKAVKKDAALRLKERLENVKGLDVEERILNISPEIQLYAVQKYDDSPDCDYVTEKTIGYFTSVAYGLSQDKSEENNSSRDLQSILDVLFQEETDMDISKNIVIPCSHLWVGKKHGFFLMIDREKKAATVIGLPKKNKRSFLRFGFRSRKNRTDPQKQLHELLNNHGIKKCIFKRTGNFKFLMRQWKQKNKKTEKRCSTFEKCFGSTYS